MPVSSPGNHCFEGELTFDDPFLDSRVVLCQFASGYLRTRKGRALLRFEKVGTDGTQVQNLRTGVPRS